LSEEKHLTPESWAFRVGARSSHREVPVNDSESQPHELRIVHSSAGRLRVHFPDPCGYIVARLSSLPGITSVSSSELTGNTLILFNPQLTDTEILCREIRSLSGETTPLAFLPDRAALVPILSGEDRHGTPALRVLQPVEDPASGPVPLTGARRRVYQALGWTSVGLAGIGAATPGIPTVPFALLAGYFFVRSSPSAHAWLLQSRWLGPALRDWEEHRGVKRSVKYAAVTMMGVGLTVTLLLGLPPELIAAILTLEALGLVIVLRLPEVPSEPTLAVAEL
jgi:uncharacterized membrane protein YbaN (DUF454 family)